jgi:uncharacterized protein YndB with AHSA1/START domain
MKKEKIKKTVTIEQTEFIKAKPVDVFNAFTDPKKHSEFTGAEATGNPKVGNEFIAWDGYISGKYLKLEKGKKIVAEWITTEWPDGFGPSLLEITFAEKGDGTQVTLKHSEVPVEQAESYKQGWIDFYWKPLKKYFK